MSRNPQAAQMADESMVRTLAAQAAAIWPQEAPLFDRYALPPDARILDVGCGSGELTVRLAERFAGARLVGVDVLDAPLVLARERAAAYGPRVRFERGDAFALGFEADAFDLVVCRHVTQAVPEPSRLLAELLRVCRPGGWMHVLSEDYGMLHFPHDGRDPERLFSVGLRALSRATGIDERVGRTTWSRLTQLGAQDARVDYVVLDTLRVPRETFAAILRGWRDGYAAAIDASAGWTAGEARALFDDILAKLADPRAYAVWFVPIVSARKP